MSPEAVHAILADFDKRATRVAVRADGRETWRFRVDDAGPTYDLHFYPDDVPTGFRRARGVSAAVREFTQLQSLQTLAIPATRVVANLRGFRLGERKGDACIVVHDPAALPLDELLRTSPPRTHHERLELLAAWIERLESLSRVNMCPTPLDPATLSLRGPVMVLTEGDWTLEGKVDTARLAEADAITRHITRVSDRLRIWRHFLGPTPAPRKNGALKRSAGALARDALFGAGPFSEITSGDWTGRFLRRLPMILPWSAAGGLEISQDDWLRVLPDLLDVSRGTPIKSDESSLVTTQTIQLAGRSIDIVAKRPLFKPGFHGAAQRYRRSRVMRAWLKTWRLLAMGLPCEVPLIVLERRRGWRLVEQVYVVERVPGPTMESLDLSSLSERERSRLMWSAGRTLRQLERDGFRHADAKSANWIAWTDPRGHVKPIMLDLDATRIYGRRGEGAARLARSLRAHPQVVESDLATLAAAYRWPR